MEPKLYKDIYWNRMIDVNVNRASEGVRVLEDLAKFAYQRKSQASQLRELRHRIRKQVGETNTWARLPNKDMGLTISQELQLLDSKISFEAVWHANASRVGEALRVLEECYHALGEDGMAKCVEDIRHTSYRVTRFYKSIEISGLYPIIDSNGDWITQLAEFKKNGIQWIQYRDKVANSASRYHSAVKLRALTENIGIKLLINDDVALAIACGADGVHLGQEDMPVLAARTIAPHLILGLSTHNREQVLDAANLPIDYIAVGPIFTTSSKENPEACEGPELIRYASEISDKPIVAIGGITENRIASVKNAGATAIAAIQSFSNSTSLRACARAWQNF